MTAAVELGDAVRAEIYAHARAAFPAECCGYVTAEAIVVRCHNAQEDVPGLVAGEPRSADRGFVIAGRELLAFARSFDGPHPARIVYHSHPNGRAYFSALDQAMAAGPAYPVQHLVVGITAERVVEAAQYAWSPAAGAYVELARWSVDA